MTGQKALKYGVALVLVSAVLVAAMFWHYWPPSKASLELGMTTEKVEADFGRSFAYTLTFRECTIGWMPINPLEHFLNDLEDVLTGASRIDTEAAVDSVDQLPTVYAYLECLFNPEGKLVAYTFSGEEVKIHTVIGALPGQMLCELSEEQWERIVAGEARDAGE